MEILCRKKKKKKLKKQFLRLNADAHDSEKF